MITLDRDVVTQQPAWPGQPDYALWAYPDLLRSGDGEAAEPQQFMNVLLSLRRRLELLVNLSQRHASRADLCSDLRDIAYVP